MSTYVWPRLPAASATSLFEEMKTVEPAGLRVAIVSHPDAAPIAVGGSPVPLEIVTNTQRRVRQLADGLGFPRRLKRPAVASFDQPASRLLHQSMHIMPADAASDEVWNFVSLVLLPDVAVWRFPQRAEERILGRPRNVFRRLWWRAETIGSDLIDVAGGLGEDELVNIMERATLAASPRTARALARTVLEQGPKVAVARSELMRDVTKRVLRRQAVLALDALDDAGLQRVLNACMTETVMSMK